MSAPDISAEAVERLAAWHEGSSISDGDMDDAIKRALEVAVIGYDMARVKAHGGNTGRDMMSDANRASIAPMIAAAIAAFLEALPDELLDTVPDVGYMDAVACRNAWLTAVRRAAGGG